MKLNDKTKREEHITEQTKKSSIPKNMKKTSRYWPNPLPKPLPHVDSHDEGLVPDGVQRGLDGLGLAFRLILVRYEFELDVGVWVAVGVHRDQVLALPNWNQNTAILKALWGVFVFDLFTDSIGSWRQINIDAELEYNPFIVLLFYIQQNRYEIKLRKTYVWRHPYVFFSSNTGVLPWHIHTYRLIVSIDLWFDKNKAINVIQ